MLKRFKVVVLVFFVFGSTIPGYSQIDIGGLTGGLNALRVGVPFLIIAPDSRAGALGDAGVASTPDVHSQHWNPAKYAFIDKEFGVSLSYTPWLRNLINDINLSYLAGYYRLDDQQVISGTLLYFSMGDIIFTNDQGQTMTTHNPNEFAFDAAYSRKFADNIGGAIAFRYIRSDLTGGFSQQGQAAAKAGSSAATDVSMYYETPLSIDNKDHEMALGLNISNIGNKISYNDDATKDFIPINMRLGGRFTYNMDIYNSVSFIIDANKLLVPTPPLYDREGEDPDIIIAGMDPNVSVPAGMMQSFYDAPAGYKEELREISFAAGIEYWYSGQFAIRAGYFDEHATKGNRKYFTIGAGLKYNVFNLDFAYLVPRAGQANPLANTVRFTLSFEFEPTKRGSSQRPPQ
jgi:hypothetical protein